MSNYNIGNIDNLSPYRQHSASRVLPFQVIKEYAEIKGMELCKQPKIKDK